MNTKTMPKFFTSGTLQNRLVLLGVVIAVAFTTPQCVQSGTFEWTGGSGSSDNWSAATNWTLTGGTDADGIPDSDDDVAFYQVAAARLTTNTVGSTNRSVNSLSYSSTSTSAVTTGGAFTLTVGAGGLTVDVSATGHSISAPINLGGALPNVWTINNVLGYIASGNVDVNSNARSFTKAGVGPLTLGGASGTVDLRGGVTVSGGLVTLAGAPTNNYFNPTTGSSSVSIAALSTLDMLGGDGEIDSNLTGPGEFTNSGGTTRTLTLSKGSSGVDVDTLLSGNLAIAKTAGAVIPFTNANTYTGGTTITGGRLLANNSLGSSAVGTGGVVINNGSTGALGGSGQIGTSVNPVPITIGASGGRIEPGTSSIANKLTVFGSIDLTSVGTTDMTFKLDGLTAGSSGYDQLEQTGALNLSAGVASLNLDMFIGSDPIVGSIFTIINRPGSQTGVTGNFAGLTDGTVINVTNVATSNIVPLTIFYNYDSGDGFLNDVALVHVPEPASMALLGCGSVALYAWSRQRRRSK